MTFFYISPRFAKIIMSPLLSQISPLFSENSPAFYILCVYFPPTLTMMHLCITQCTYWTPLFIGSEGIDAPGLALGSTLELIALKTLLHESMANVIRPTRTQNKPDH